MILDTERLILRPFEGKDAQPFSDYRSDPEVARYQGWETPFTVSQASAFIHAMQLAQPGKAGEWYQLAIQHKASGTLLGDCGFYTLTHAPRQAEIGYTLARSFQRQGYAAEAVTRLLDYLFDDLDLHLVRANCDVDNLASIRLLERLGFRREEHRIESWWSKSGWTSEYGYAILKREWQVKLSRDAI